MRLNFCGFGTQYTMAQATLTSHNDWHLPQGAASAAAVGGAATSNPAVVSSQPVTAEPPSRIKDFLIRQHLPLGLFVMVVLGFLWPEPGIAVGKTPISSISIFLIFLISGLGLETKAVKTAVKAYASITFGVLSIIVM